jgi:hypothetical protein
MGKTSFSGPVYGAKQTLFSVGPIAASTGSSAVFAGTVVPPGEDWFATELLVYRNSTGSTNFVVSLHDDSTLMGTATVSGSSIAVSNYSIITKDASEYEGARLASGSVLTLSHSSHAGPNINLFAVVRGFTRFANSTRPE